MVSLICTKGGKSTTRKTNLSLPEPTLAVVWWAKFSRYRE